MRVGKLFHLTLLVDDFEAAQHFFNSVFSPLCMMHGYSSHWHRTAAIYVVAETCMEPMHVLAPREGEQATSWYRYMERFGPRAHNLAFYVDDAEALDQQLEEAGVRTTLAGTVNSVFAHPKDTPGMLEFAVAGDGFMADPRFEPGWEQFQQSYWSRHPLGLERLSHVTVLVHDADKATAFYVDALDAVPLPESQPTLEGADSRYVLVGENTVVELTAPPEGSGPAWHDLQEVGEGVFAVTFKVRDVERAEQHLRTHEAPIASVDATTVILDRARTWGVEYRFTTSVLGGDHR